MVNLNNSILTATLARAIIVSDMKKLACILAIAVGCSILSDVQSAPKPITLALEQRTTLHVGELAVLHIPSDRRYLHSVNGAWRDVLALVQQSGRDVTFRAARPGMGTIIISPNTKNGECISCATLHYFIEVFAQK
jgi:hypothetical protein